MKKIFATIALAFGLGCAVNAQESLVPTLDPNAPEMKFETEVLDYGTVKFDGNGIREFKVKNIGKSPLTITAVTAECGCTTTTIDGKQGWPGEPILPGKSGVIKIKYDTKRVGRFEKNITISSNGKFASKKVKIKGEIKAKPGGEEAGPIFLATVRGGGITKKNQVGLWAVDSTGLVRQILRTGDLFNDSIITGITALSTVPGALGASRGFNSDRKVAVRLAVRGNRQSIVVADIP